MFHPELCEAVAAALKHHTVHAHQSLEDLLIPKLHAIDTPEKYVRLLRTFYGYFSPVEELIGQYIDRNQLEDINERRKAAFLLSDIASLGYPAHTIALSECLPSINNKVQAWGAMYVLEGSTLGGQGITHMLLKQCKALSREHLTFFNGYGGQTGPKWLRFVETLNNLEYSPTEMATLVQAANETFINFKKWIEQTLA